MAGKFVLKPNGDRFMFNLLSEGNGDVLLTSQGYSRPADAKAGIVAVKINAPMEANYDRRTSDAGEAYFVLRAGNEEVIGTSDTYSRARMRDEGIFAVKTTAPTATIEDWT
jgi:uncharacterized protein YegP (UPF0339 family)